MALKQRYLPAVLLAASLTHLPVYAADTDSSNNSAKGKAKRQIEEVTVTAERRESSVQDTSISITAFTAQALDDFGIRNQSDLQNMVPATVIMPYDAAIRGVGRNFRNLGGDPGVATYIDNVYSEDLYTATIGSMWDIKRVEILRGPQGTLYGRNAVGGAMNFIYKEPTDVFEAAVKGIVGDYGTSDGYAAISGPLVAGKLDGRMTLSSRKHDGWVQEKGIGPDLDSGDERNIALQLLWTPTDNISVKLRSNYAKVDRVMGGADGGGLVMFYGQSYGGATRDYTHGAYGYRRVDPTQTNPLAHDFVDPSMQIFTFNDPTTGAAVQAQYLRSGIDAQQDFAGNLGVGLPNYGMGLTGDPSQCVFRDYSNIKGKDVCAQTNGLNNETFDQQGNQFQASWDVRDGLTIKYIYGLNNLMYRRDTDDDKDYNPNSDRQFYVNHEAEYQSHELQAFWDLSDKLTFTSGIFFYQATIDQRGDFFSAAGQPQFTQADPFSVAIFGANTMVGLYTARARNPDLPDCLVADCPGGLAVATGAWEGDQGGGKYDVYHGPDTVGTDLLYATETNRDAFAAYTQGVWDINDHFTLTVGLRYAEDKLAGEENLFRYTEAYVPAAALAGVGITSLAALNIYRGALDPVTLQPTGNNFLLNAGIPLSLSVHRNMHRKDTKLTYRVNLDWQMTDNIMMYANVTTGYRAGGYNLVFFSRTPTYDPEKLVAYEIGYKGQHLDNTLQTNLSAYLYDYSSIHTFGAEPSATGGTTTSVLAAPGANIYGFEGEILYLATDRLTLGGNFSFTPSKYDKDFYLSDVTNPNIPASLFDVLKITTNLNGKQVLNVPRYKGSAYAQYTIPTAGGGSVELLANYSWISKVYDTPFQLAVDTAPAYQRLDLRATWTSADSRWVVAGYVNNVMDEIGIRQIEPTSEDEGFRRTGQVTEPRNMGVEFTYKMGGYQ